ncbi:hypothetical protein [Martelella alba]|uniref:Intracellular septation protein A n=1 Tax=Martelella alba TaxID=2590451 RepID=A0ABY2SQK3_9HYPH|nr:hypothetical protein [Martelella alba]TKI07680.1 hypothetical protein FCN80_04335 [Martelella alba]
MQDDVRFVLKKMGFFVLFAVIAAAFQSLLFLDIHALHDSVKETSLTEITQELILLGIVLLYARLTKVPELRASSVLLCGFFACMLIRELDFVFDVIRQGSWVWVALAVTGISIIVAARDFRGVISGLREFFTYPSYGLICAGLLNVLIFSRLMGMGVLWRTLLQEAFLRTVKNAVEEGSELFGYVLCLLGTVIYVFGKLRYYRRK